MAVRRFPTASGTTGNLANVAVGSVSITTTVANTPVAATVTGFQSSLAGSGTIYALATAQTATPHLIIASTEVDQVKGDLTVWLNRSTVGTSVVNYIVWQNY
jgi:hypothetical protein